MASLSQIAPAALFRFEDFELDASRLSLLQNGRRVKLQPQPLRVLHHLVAAAPAIVSRDQLASAIWPDVHVDLDQSLNFCIRQIRAALNDSASHPRFVETLPKQGYRFIAPLFSLDPGAACLPEPASVPPTTPFPKPVSLLDPTQSAVAAVPASPHRRKVLRPLLLTASAAGIAAALALSARIGHPTHPSPPPTPHLVAVLPEAHDAYLRGRYLWFRGANEAAGQAFRRATELQPDYALAWSGLANFYGQIAGASVDPRDALPHSEAAARRAVALDDTSAEAHLSLGAAVYFNRWDFSVAEREIDRALELNPHLAQALHFRAKILSSVQRHTEAIAAERAAAELDPFARPWAMADRYLLARRYDDARQSALEHLRAEPNSLHSLQSLETIDRDASRPGESVSLRIRRLDLTGDHAAATRLRSTFARGGYRAVLLSDLADLRQKTSRQYVSPFDLATLYAQLGDRDNAMLSLEEALRQRHPDLLLVQNMAIFDPLHDDPRYLSLVRTIGLPSAF